ncbi:AEC family transporter, partial [Aliarcobacter butzleri]
PFSVALIIKLLIAPLIAMIICQIFGWHNTAATVSIMEAAMPTMITAGAIASMAGLAPKISSAIEGNGTMISLFTTGLFYCIA